MISSDNLALNNSTNDEDFTYSNYRELLKMAKSGWKILDYGNIDWDENSPIAKCLNLKNWFTQTMPNSIAKEPLLKYDLQFKQDLGARIEASHKKV